MGKYDKKRVGLNIWDEKNPEHETVVGNREYGPAGREDIDKLLMNKLPEILTEGQKKAKIHNLIV